MLKPILLLAAVSAAPVVAQTAPPTKGMARDQYLARQSGRIMAADTDGDGRVSSAEFSAARSGGKGQGDPARAFGRMDANHDGFVDKAEIETVLTRRFQRADRDGDGILSAAERHGGRKGAGAAPAAPATPQP